MPRLDEPVPDTVSMDEVSTLYTVRHVSDHVGPLHPQAILAPADMPDHIAIRLYVSPWTDAADPAKPHPSPA